MVKRSPSLKSQLPKSSLLKTAKTAQTAQTNTVGGNKQIPRQKKSGILNFSDLYEHREEGEVTFIEDRYSFRIHAHVLEAQSSYFRKIIKDYNDQKKELVFYIDKRTGMIGKLIKYLYTGNAENLSEWFIHVWNLAKKFKFTELIKKIDETAYDFTFANVGRRYDSATLLRNHTYVKCIVEYLAINKAFFESEEFEEMERGNWDVAKAAQKQAKIYRKQIKSIPYLYRLLLANKRDSID